MKAEIEIKCGACWQVILWSPPDGEIQCGCGGVKVSQDSGVRSGRERLRDEHESAVSRVELDGWSC
jgi:hypothetical protein